MAPGQQVEFRENISIVVYTLQLMSHSEAMDRIHRLGQRRPVQAIKIVVEDSIESRIVQLQEKKSAMVDATLSTDDSVRVLWIPWTTRLLTGTSLQAMGRLTPDDVRPYLSTTLAMTDLFSIFSCHFYSEYCYSSCSEILSTDARPFTVVIDHPGQAATWSFGFGVSKTTTELLLYISS